MTLSPWPSAIDDGRLYCLNQSYQWFYSGEWYQ
jgi:hypothetical protein